MAYKLAPLPYDFNALEPYIDARTMEIHYTAHHAGYVAKLNAALEAYPELMSRSVEDLVRHYMQLPESVRTAVRNQGGGDYNHTFFWQIMSPGGTSIPSSLDNAVNKHFGTMQQFQQEFAAKAASVFGSGWAWLCRAPDKKLEIITTANQDSPISTHYTPILGLDVWEHAYYLKHQSKRASYIEAWWHVVNWNKVNELYRSAEEHHTSY
jgi:Fe-Mn family superoxide dismutase